MTTQRDTQKSMWFDQPITDADVLAIFETQEEILTRKQIASRLDRQKTPSLIARIEALVDRHALERDDIPQRNGLHKFFYRLASQEDNRNE